MAGIFQSGVYSMGFDMKPTAAQVFTQAANGSASTTQLPFGTGWAWNLNNSSSGVLLGTNLVTINIGIRVWITSYPSSGTSFLFEFFDATANAPQVQLRLSTTGVLQFYLGSAGSTTIGPASSTLALPLSTWTYLEAKVTISASVGFVELKKDGSTIITTAASQNTKNTANTFQNCFRFGNNSNSFFDDWIMLDTTGSSPLNTYIGPVQVKGDPPSANSAVGGRNAWTPTNPQNDNHLNVGNIPASTSQYNASSTVGQYDMFRFPSITAASVLFVNYWASTELDVSGIRTIAQNCYSGGTDSQGSSITPATGTFGYSNQVVTLDPNTSAAWTVSNAANAEGGVRVTL